MKILQINSVNGVGSTGRIASDLQEGLRQAGEECRIAYGRGPANDSDRDFRIGSRAEVLAHVAETRLADRHGFGSLSATRRFVKQAEVWGPDLVHLHNVHGYYLHVGELMDFLRSAAIPVIWTLHDCWPFTGHCAYYEYVGCDRWQTGCGHCPQKKSYPASLLFDRSVRNFEDKKRWFSGFRRLTLVTPSEWLAGEVGRSFLSEYPIRVIQNGIDLSVFHPVPGEEARRRIGVGPQERLVLGAANVWEERKGLRYLAALSERLGSGYRVAAVGVTPREAAALPRAMIALPRTDRVEELAALYSAADVFVNPTMEDNFPTANLEAIACGTPVVTFRTGGSTETVDDRTGLVVEKGEEAALAEAVETILSRAKARYAADCVARAADRFDRRRMVARYLECYREAISQ